MDTYADFDGTGSLTNRYLNGPAVDMLLARVDAAGDEDWYLTDNLGSVRQIVDTDGTVLDAIDYDSYGNILSESNPTAGDRFKYTGREWDAAADLYFYRARYYDPTTGRFISEDPIGFGGGDTNLARYVGNASTRWSDPMGLQVIRPGTTNTSTTTGQLSPSDPLIVSLASGTRVSTTSERLQPPPGPPLSGLLGTSSTDLTAILKPRKPRPKAATVVVPFGQYYQALLSYYLDVIAEMIRVGDNIDEELRDYRLPKATPPPPFPQNWRETREQLRYALRYNELVPWFVGWVLIGEGAVSLGGGGAHNVPCVAGITLSEEAFQRGGVDIILDMIHEPQHNFGRGGFLGTGVGHIGIAEQMERVRQLIQFFQDYRRRDDPERTLWGDIWDRAGPRPVQGPPPPPGPHPGDRDGDGDFDLIDHMMNGP